MKELPPILQWWVSPKLPKEHIFVDPEKLPEDLYQKARLYFRKWLVHPVKRHLAHHYSEFLTKRGCEIIGITGSAGKTTAKEMIASVLSQKYRTVWTKENIDPVYNIPTTILSTPANTEKLVLEMGIEFPGEMDFYLWLARPSIGVITTIYWTHTQFLGDIEGVIGEKGKLIKSLPKGGYAVLNKDDANVRKLGEVTRAKVIWYSTNSDADIKGSDIKVSEDLKTNFKVTVGNEEEEVNLQLLGQHFVPLALAAIAVGRISGLSLFEIKVGLEKVRGEPHRMRPFVKTDGTIIVDDTYNANPLATLEAIKVLSHVGKGRRKILVLGEMKELGVYEEKGHREVGAFAVKEGVDMIFTLGDLTRFILDEASKGIPKNNLFLASDQFQLIERLKLEMKAKDIVLIKGSRSIAMEKVVDALI